MKKVKWGILGCANIARKAVIPGIIGADNSELYAVASRNKEKAADFAEEFDADKYYDDYQKLLEDEEIEAVYIPLPNGLHKEWTIKAAEAGKHILCEKPLSGKSKAEAEEMFAAAKKNKVKLMEAFMYRFQPFVIKLKEMIEKGVIGEVKEIKSNFAFDISDRKDDIRLNAELDGGALNDIGCYTVNISRYLMGGLPTKVANFFEKETAAGVDLSGSAILYFEGGVFASLYYSLNSYNEQDLELVGTEGIIRIPGFFSWLEDNYFLLDKNGEVERIPVETGPQYLLEVEAFAEAVLNDTEVPLKVDEETYANLKVMDAMRKSAAEETVVKL
ncbi:putative dehydrogenase [Halanaerobium saccharolyticum]|uniref:Putative dehydrogenase n=1 Tax=Halanaerobium saccharolyticum TaxID=43595 RepID=A0A4R7ZE40_9FIRM|nr:Gfo/Idh/MocA family oxidoreductase [Halanaerobium saccharolyticum]RAK08576.1 putative dehydrogenase [Halanaerobium saccharolyticum]TDW07280.1 putative dehydrogenase [Halanaerobium saccharolyticum]TDX60128.1 putative dehydrogenase [Halanaerobium saccharolyticum]